MPAPWTVDEDPAKFRYSQFKSATRGWLVTGPPGSTEADVMGKVYAATALTEPGGVGIAWGVYFPRDEYLRIADGGMNVNPVGQGLNAWMVTATYSSNSGNSSDTAPDYQYFINELNEPVSVDDAGSIVVNSAGNLPRNPQNRSRYEMTYIVGRNEATFPAVNAKIYAGAINSDTFVIHAFNGVSGQNLTIEPGMAIMKPFRQPQKFKKAAKHLRVEYEIKIRFGEAPFIKNSAGVWDCWKIRIVDKGRDAWWQIPTPGGGILKRLKIFTIAQSGQNVLAGDDILLDGTGGVLDSTQYTGDASPANLYSPGANPAISGAFDVVDPPDGYGKILVYKGIKTANFGVLGLFP